MKENITFCCIMGNRNKKSSFAIAEEKDFVIENAAKGILRKRGLKKMLDIKSEQK